MAILRIFNVFAAVRDLRRFLAARQRHELIFGFLAVATTLVVLTGFLLDARDMAPPYKRQIIYMKDWRLDRSEAEILAQQKIDAREKAATQARLEAMQKQRRAEFKKVDDALNRLGL